ncbi:MAG: hypothetical protein ACOY99_12975 [Pseudomonadota bacterium]
MKVQPDAAILRTLYGAAEALRGTGPETPAQRQARDKGAARPAAQSVHPQPQEDAPGKTAQAARAIPFGREAPTAGARPKYVAPGQVLNILV